jgi:hypothetical protein
MLKTHLLYNEIIQSDWSVETHLTPLGWIVAFSSAVLFYYAICIVIAVLK